MLAVLGDERHLCPQNAPFPSCTVKQAPACADSSWLEWVPISAAQTSLFYLPSAFRDPPLHPPMLTSHPQELLKARNLGVILSLSYFFLLCVQVIITALSPRPAFLEVCRPFSLSLFASAKSLSRHASLATQHPSHSSVSTSGPWKSPPCSPGPTAPIIYSKAWHLLPF